MSDRSSIPPGGSRRIAGVKAAALAAGIGIAIVLAPLTLTPSLQAQAQGQQSIVPLPSLAPVVKRVFPAVVNISVVEAESGSDQTAQEDDDLGQGQGQGGQGGGQSPGGSGRNSPFDQFLRRFFEEQGVNPPSQQQQRRQRPQSDSEHIALGSGFIIDPAGFVVTNNHVVEDAQKVTVIFQDGSKHEAKIVGRDTKTDLALLKISTDKPLPYVNWGDSNAAQVGDWVIAVGNPFGLGGTVSAGIISARGRDIHSGPYDDFLQIDAPINRGNSGGPTFNLSGEVIGINTAIYSPSGGSVGIGFAIPSSLARPVIEQLKAKGKVSRGWLGVQIQELTPAIAKSLGLPNDHGALVADVNAGSPAEKAGIKQGDVILEFNGHEIVKLRDLPVVVAETSVGSSATVKVWRRGQEMTLNPTIVEQASSPQDVSTNKGLGNQPSEDVPQNASALGLKLVPLTPELRQQLKVQQNVRGVVVTSISDSSPLADSDLRAGDIIVAINQEPVSSPREAAAKLKAAQAKKGSNVLLQINRHGTNAFIAWSTQDDNG